MASPKRIFLIRHAESESNVDLNIKKSVPDHRINLTDNGMHQAFDAGLKLYYLLGDQKVRTYYSPYNRTVQTYQQIKKTIWDNVVREQQDPRIREQEFGNYLDPNIESIVTERDEFGHFFYRVQGGESGADVFDRVSTFLESLHRDFRKDDFPDNCLIVTHGLTLRLFLMRWFHWDYQYFESLRNPKNASITIMEKQSSGKYEITTPMEFWKPKEG